MCKGLQPELGINGSSISCNRDGVEPEGWHRRWHRSKKATNPDVRSVQTTSNVSTLTPSAVQKLIAIKARSCLFHLFGSEKLLKSGPRLITLSRHSALIRSLNECLEQGMWL